MSEILDCKGVLRVCIYCGGCTQYKFLGPTTFGKVFTVIKESLIVGNNHKYIWC